MLASVDSVAEPRVPAGWHSAGLLADSVATRVTVGDGVTAACDCDLLCVCGAGSSCRRLPGSAAPLRLRSTDFAFGSQSVKSAELSVVSGTWQVAPNASAAATATDVIGRVRPMAC